ncbi:nuclear transport factor 2 family protein [Pseudomaricurvus alkylphenolicus]|uniref:nuclear transport factor 2 family protein n=1 Tax=Pseudomaricurvus alkylphenolicus TaxID=1306991 RepID=UPI0014223905|nr:nuclear transport factor 2 family protein [Pseudomaricurvus alkylphenolicus]NIB43402.1 nuclear transport factor 2 family protein [Pseudomaricurvus alkylphenolicus]
MDYPDQQLQDRRLIEELVFRWALARDSDDWEALSECFHDGADIRISWIQAPAETFLSRSKEMAENRPLGMHMKHLICNNWIETNGARGFSRCNAVLLIRDHFEGVWFDFEGHFRFFDRVEKRNNVWRIVNRTAVYDKDVINPNTPAPGATLPWNDEVVKDFPPQAKYLYWWFAVRGVTCDPQLITAYSEEEAQLHAQCRHWINNLD